MATVPEIRKRAGVSRYALAQEAGLTYQGLSLIEAQKVAPKLDSLQRISAVLATKLGVPVADILAELTLLPDSAQVRA